ncbi:hypothetical protein Tco_0200068 [Tanacetum coccineum]
MRMEQYLTFTEHALWEVIVNGDSVIPVASTSVGAEGHIPPKTAEQKLARKNELKAKSTLMLAIPDEHLLKFHSCKDAHSFWEAIKNRFLVETIAERKRFFAAQRTKQIRNKPPTKTQLRNKMITYLKNMGRYTHSQLKLYEKEQKCIKNFIPMDSEEGGKKAASNNLVKLWDLVKKRFSTTEPTDDKEKELWVELKRLFKPKNNDILWKLQRYMHDPLVWRLYDTCGVHHVSSVRGHDIFMLVEKEYPLTRGMLRLMMLARLLVEAYSEMSGELLRKIFHQANRPRQPCHEAYQNTIKLPDRNNVVPLRSDTIRLVQNGCSFHKLRIHLHLGGSYYSFFAQFFPPRRNVKLQNDIMMFQQHQEDLALYDNESWNDPRDCAKPVKAIDFPQYVPSTSDRRLIDLENQGQCLVEAHLAPKSSIQVNKIASLCEICNGSYDTQYCMENPERAFVDYTSSRTNEAGVKWYTFKHEQNNLGDTYNPSWKSYPNLRWRQPQNSQNNFSNPPNRFQPNGLFPNRSFNNNPQNFNNQSNLEGLVSNFMASQDAILSKFEADFK